MRVFLGITGASGAPYAARLLAALAEAGVRGRRLRLRLRASRCSRPSSTAIRRSRATRSSRGSPTGSHGVTVYARRTTTSRPMRAARPGWTATSICPCSMATVGTIAAGAMANLVHRAASVALKEERQARPRAARDAALDHPPREHAAPAPGGRDDPLRGARLLPRAASRSTISSTSSSRDASTSSGSTTRSCGAGARRDASGAGTLPPDERARDVRPDRPGLRRDEPRDDRRARPALAALTAEAAVRPGDRVLDACCGTGDLALGRASGRAAA